MTSPGSRVSRRDFLQLAAGAAAMPLAGSMPGAFAQAAASGQAGAAPPRPNVLFVFDDQLRKDACSIYGGTNIATPHMERMAREGVVFDNAVSSCPLCTPYRGMLQTGRYPTHSGLVLNWVEVNPRQRCIAHVFAEAGYRTGFIGKWHLAAGRKKMIGYHEATPEQRQASARAKRAYLETQPEPEFVPPGPQRLGYQHWEAYNFHGDYTHYWYYEDTSARLHRPGYETDIQTDQAIEFMRRQQAAGQPFFLMVAPHPPHPPFAPKFTPPGYLDQVPEKLNWLPNVPADFALRDKPMPARCYYAMAKNVDDNLGRLLSFLDESGLSENTVVVFTSDHGEMMGSHGREHKMVPYAEAAHIPLIVRWRGHLPAGTRTDALQCPIDHMPTLCGLAGLTAPDTADGRDLTGLLLRKEKPDRDAILMANYVSNWDFFDSGTLWPEWRAVRTERHTYIKWLTGKEELYDNAEDPYQMRDLAAAGQTADLLKRLRSRLKDLLAEAHDEFLPGTAYAEWYDESRNLVKTALGPV